MSVTGGDPGLRALAAAAFRAHVSPMLPMQAHHRGFHALESSVGLVMPCITSPRRALRGESTWRPAAGDVVRRTAASCAPHAFQHSGEWRARTRRRMCDFYLCAVRRCVHMRRMRLRRGSSSTYVACTWATWRMLLHCGAPLPRERTCPCCSSFEVMRPWEHGLR